MEERFSTYLTEIGLLNETASSSLIKKDEKSSNKSFADSTFQYLKNYFDNLDEEQKNYMSLYIPSKFISISDKTKRTKLKSLTIQLILRQKLILLKYFLQWKNNIILLNTLYNYSNNLYNKENIDQNSNEINSDKNLFNNIANKYNKNKGENNYINLNLDEYKDNVSSYNLINIDRNIDIDNKNITKTEEEQLSKINKSNPNNSAFFVKTIINDSDISKKNKMKINSKNIKKMNRNYKIKDKGKIKPYSYRNDKKINKNKTQININEYKTINIKNRRNNNNKSINSINNCSSIRNTSKNHLHTSLEEKELRELQECTFKPKINESRKKLKKVLSQNDINSSLIIQNNNNSKNKEKREKEIQLRFEKLYKDNEKYQLAKEMKAIEYEHIMSRNAPFIPNIKKSKNNSLNKNRQKSEGNFEERQQEYLEKKNKHSSELKNKINSENDELCPFYPKITNDKGEYYQIRKKEKINKRPVFIRLYEDCKDRQNFHKQKEKENFNKIMNLSNILNPKKNFNFETINRLYENREQKDSLQKTRKKVEEEEGITFKPYIPDNNYIKEINGTFYERSRKFMNDKESFYEEENKRHKESLRNSAEKKEYTKEQRKQIVDNIINRLYNDSIQSNNKPINNVKGRNIGGNYK